MLRGCECWRCCLEVWRGTLSSRDVCFFARSFRFGNAKAECSHSCNQNRSCCSIPDADDEPMATVAALYNRPCYSSPCSGAMLAHAVAALQNRSCYNALRVHALRPLAVAALQNQPCYSQSRPRHLANAAVAALQNQPCYSVRLQNLP